MRPVLMATLALLGACATGVLTGPRPLEVAEVRRALVCRTTGDAPQVTLMPDLVSVRGWEKARQIDLTQSGDLPAGAYAIVEMGERPTGGYGIAVSRQASQRTGAVQLTASFLNPPADRMVTQMLTSPCALVWLGTGNFKSVQVVDQEGTVRASTLGAVK